MQFEFSRLQGRGLNGLEGQSRGWIRIQRPRLPQDTNFLNFRGCEAAVSVTSEVKTDARFGLNGPSYLLGPDFEAVVESIEPVEVVKKQMDPKKDGHLRYKTAGSAAVKTKGG